MSAAGDVKGWRGLRDYCRRCWDVVLDLTLILWVVRVPFTMVAVGCLILALLPQAQDLFVELAETDGGSVPRFLLLLFFIWALPTHYSARLLLDTDERLRLYATAPRSRCFEWLEQIVPRFLGMMTFAAMLIALYRSWTNLPVLSDPGYIQTISWGLARVSLYVIIAAALFSVYVVKRDVLASNRVLQAVQAGASQAKAYVRGAGRPSVTPQDSHAFGQLLLLIVFAAFALVLVFGAEWAAEVFPRGQSVPLVFGGWLPFLTFLAYHGRRLRAPLILVTIVVVTVLAGIVGDNHDVRRINAAEFGGMPAEQQMSLNDAINAWKTANKCEAENAVCPRPIIVAGAGGASRAGFFTSSIIGHFLQDAKDHGLVEQNVLRQFFAISGISGSSVGAVMSTTAMAAAGAGGAQPCRAGKPPLWYGVAINNWRDCLEALMAGDFLTPVFIGVMFHDTVRFGWWRDRGALLEDAWQRHYLSVVVKASDQKPAGGCLGLDCAFTALRPTAQHWFPLLLLNGVSVETGQRIVTAILKPNYTPKDGNRCPTGDRPDAAASSCLLLAQTFDFHKLLADTTEPKGWLAKAQRYLMKDYRHNRKLDDVWLSTAAHNSARFPLISPPGNIRNGAHQIIDRIVDGGYFEGFGALTAMEIALAVRAAEPKLAPFVVVVSNDPNLAIDHDDDSVLVQQQDKLPDTPDVEFFTEVVGPLTTFINAWNAHGGLAVKQLRSVLYRTMPECENVAHIRVWPESQERSERSRAVSMSWWLSKPIQRHLHQQTEDVKNKKQNREPINKVWRALAPTSTCGKR